MRSRAHYLLLAAPHAALVALIALRFLVIPDVRGYGTHEQLGLGACRFRDWLGGPCPTCGVTTSASHVVRGDILAAWQTQPLGVVGSIALAVWLYWSWRAHRSGGDLAASWSKHGPKIWSTAALAALTCWWIASAASAPG